MNTVNTSYKVEPYIPRVWGFWAYFFCFVIFFVFFDTFWFKFGSGTPPSVSGTINSTWFRPSFIQFRQILAIFDQFFAMFDQFLDVYFNFLTSLRPKMRVLRAYDCWSIGPRVSELKVKACDGVLTVHRTSLPLSLLHKAAKIQPTNSLQTLYPLSTYTSRLVFPTLLPHFGEG